MTKGLVILSGGQDSTTCLAWALSKFDEVEAITFSYGQRHEIEIEQSTKIAAAFRIKHKIVELSGIKQTAISNLLEKKEKLDINEAHKINPELPSSFVPGRNLIFITYAAIYAYGKNIKNLVTGVCETDYSGYPDCRMDTITALQNTLNVGMEANFIIHTPLMYLTKAETIQLMQDLGHLDKLALTQTCYNGVRPGCGKCPSCKIRANGFEEAGIEDPLFKGEIEE